MANLNIPFLLLQPSICDFKPSLSSSKLISYCKYNSNTPSPAVRNHQSSSLRHPPSVSTNANLPDLRQSNNFDNESVAFEYGKYSTFDDTPKNLVVLGDAQSGTIVLCHEEHYHSTKKSNSDNKSLLTTKFIVSLIPRVSLIPSISVDAGPLIDFALIRSPAPYILATSQFFLVTLHDDNRIRLWNTNDGRCVMTSQKELLVTKAMKIKVIKSHPGNILLVGKDKDVYVVNVYKMMLLKHFQYEIEGCAGCIVRERNLIICDLTGRIYILKDESEPPQNNRNLHTSAGSIFELSNNQEAYDMFAYNLESSVGEDETQPGNRVLSFNFTNKDQILVITAFRIDIYLQKTRKTIFQFYQPDSEGESRGVKLIFGKTVKLDEREMIMVIDNELTLYLYDFAKLRHEVQQKNRVLLDYSESAVVELNLARDARYFDHSLLKQEDQHVFLNDNEQIREEQLHNLQTQILQLIKDESQSIFKYNRIEKFLYTVLPQQQKGMRLIPGEKQSKMVCWDLTTLIENLIYKAEIRSDINFKLPVFSSIINVFPHQINNCPINFYPLVIKNFYNKHQFQFFFSDESITDSVIYTSNEHPALIIGTNYGRIFMVPMFQETDEHIFPVILIDQHHRSAITQLFVAYNSSRKQQRSSNKSASSQNIGHHYHINQSQVQPLNENGGHLISCSDDGTIAVTNLNSGEINKMIHNYLPGEKSNQVRVDAAMHEINVNRAHNRRNSFTQYFTTNNYFQMVKVKSQRVLQYQSFSPIQSVIEVKSIQRMQEKLFTQPYSKNKGMTPDRASENQQHDERQQSPIKRRGSFSSASPLLNEELDKSLPTYACLSDDGVVVILHLSNLHADTSKLTGMDSKAIGVYSDEEQNQLYVLSETLNFYVYNQKSLLLLRKLDFHQAINVLLIRETLELLQAKNDGFKLASKGESNIFEYEIFEKVFRKKSSLLMGLGSHKILDFLSLSLNLPLQYHPHSLFSPKYTKTLHDLFELRSNLYDFPKKEAAQKAVLKAINDSIFINNRLYKSDFNEEYFDRQCGVTCVQTNQSVFASRQHVVIASTKQMIQVLKHKMQKIKANKGANVGGVAAGLAKAAEDNQDDDFIPKEEFKRASEMKTPKNRISKIERRSSYGKKIESESLANHKWPIRLLSLIHPFNIDVNVDEALEKFFGLNLPFLDFRVGIQGADESFSFIITKEDEEYHSERQNITKILRLLKLSQFRKKNRKTDINLQEIINKQEEVLEFNINIDDLVDTEASVRFFGSEYWKISSYMSTIIPCFFLSTLVSIVEFNQADVTFLLQEWLFILQTINQQKTIHNNNGVLLSVISKIILEKEPNISTTGRDIILKPILYTIDNEQLKHPIDEWASLILDTYKRLKKESSLRSAYGHGQDHQQQFAGRLMQGIQNQFDKINHSQQNPQHGNGQQSEKKLINQYFGELEIRGLINISYFALYYNDQLDQTLQYRVSKLTTILTREIVDKFNHNKKYIHLLTLLLQLLSTWMKTQSNSFNNKAIISEVIKLLLFIYNINKAPLNRENVIMRITGENFHLIKPTHSELYLKLTAVKALLEIGENFTYDFLQQIQEEATNLMQGPEYQQNVLEILKFFINGYGENLENHLIQLTQILLKCLDPNELALRKNSHKIISVILSIMVKMFPMVAFHHDSQRLAVGTHDGPIAIYDVRTSAKWKILEGHSANVTCLNFDSKGNLLASYSAIDLTLRLWKVGNTGFFSTIMGGTGKSSHQINLKPIKNAKNPHMSLQQKRNHQTIQQSEQRQNNNLLEEGSKQGGASQSSSSSKRINPCVVRFLMPKEKEVELFRENGMTERHKLVK